VPITSRTALGPRPEGAADCPAQAASAARAGARRTSRASCPPAPRTPSAPAVVAGTRRWSCSEEVDAHDAVVIDVSDSQRQMCLAHAAWPDHLQQPRGGLGCWSNSRAAATSDFAATEHRW
jgi:hypothetical protein